MHRSSNVYMQKQSKTALNKNMVVDFGVREQIDFYSLEEASLWIMDSSFGRQQRFEVKLPQ